ncbi:DNA repair exonuclease, partial [Lactobacillus sp. XV13L]|nr:DNA repair exonuclease [Lactobacillus sp. XV13L]
MKFIHTADLHLGSPFKGLTNLPSAIRQAVHNSIYQAFDTLVAQAIDLKVDFIVIAGDEFDNVERDLQAQLYLQQKFLELAQHHIPVFLIYGNHDYLTSSQAIVSYPSNVHVFGPQISSVTLKLVSGLRIAVSGFSYDQNHLTANKA